MLLEEIQFGLSGQSINCPMEPGLDPEQPINNVKKNKSIYRNNFFTLSSNLINYFRI